jgi:Kef-type K+ transport system membrane component KefB
MIGITLVEDLAVICMTVIIPVLGNSKNGGWLMAIWVLGKALLLLVPLTLLAIKVIPPLLRRVKIGADYGCSMVVLGFNDLALVLLNIAFANEKFGICGRDKRLVSDHGRWG